MSVECKLALLKVIYLLFVKIILIKNSLCLLLKWKNNWKVGILLLMEKGKRFSLCLIKLSPNQTYLIKTGIFKVDFFSVLCFPFSSCPLQSAGPNYQQSGQHNEGKNTFKGKETTGLGNAGKGKKALIGTSCVICLGREVQGRNLTLYPYHIQKSITRSQVLQFSHANIFFFKLKYY